MLTAVILVVHVVVCIALILIILLQTGKGADIGAVFGGGSNQTVFGSTGAATFLSKITVIAAVVFMVTSIVLTYFSGKAPAVQERSLMTEQSAPAGGPVVPPVGKESPGKEQGPPVNSNAQGADNTQKTSPNPTSETKTDSGAK
ncbi:MAG: preprotein translocase subunit SecG [Desulfomonilaceae bacterium]|jgi:preprotein translocase subunit SecG